MARQTLLTKEIQDLICDSIAEDEHGLKWHCENTKGFPSYRAIRNWLIDPRYKEFQRSYDLAKQAQADLMVDKMIEIIDDVPVRKDAIDKAKGQVDTRKFIAAKLRPRKYGDRTFTGYLDKDGEPTDITPKYNYGALDKEELEILKKILGKCEIK